MAGEAEPDIVDLTVPLPYDRAKLTDAFYDFYSVGEHSANGYLVLRKTTRAVVRVTYPESPLIFYCRNQWAIQHAELVVIAKLKTELRPRARAPDQSPSSKTVAASSKSPTADPPPRSPDADPALSVDLFINYSPCRECCQALKDFKAQHEIRLTVIFSALYNIKRSSCMRNPACAAHLKSSYPSPAISKQNEEGLRLLLENGIALRLFEEADWRFLVSVLPMDRTPDRIMREDLDAICRKLECASPPSDASKGRMVEEAEPVTMNPNKWAKLTDAFYDFYSVGGHSASGHLVLRETTWVVVRVTHGAAPARFFYCWNQEGEQHAEQVAIKTLGEKLDEKLPPCSVELFINYSPCPACCQKMIKFKADHPEIRMTAISSVRYNINCKSEDDAINENEEGLQLLLAPGSGVTLRHFEDADWRFLVCMLPMGRTADQDMKKDLKAICPQTGAGDGDPVGELTQRLSALHA